MQILKAKMQHIESTMEACSLKKIQNECREFKEMQMSVIEHLISRYLLSHSEIMFEKA